ncbi:glycosyltransferase [Alteromonas sp. RKMC-009]|uniref:glycosyltransferase n=1 Tax=Alteromonas sp. RKMC-009 TaxID=2267264 RepID=UPI000E679F09|nr:glycosyltransferase [Alteromonas sp. RKMC-009]AYA63000.1 hypothetical protein DS731_02685 [Alteromonas sp. RKMC-009]
MAINSLYREGLISNSGKHKATVYNDVTLAFAFDSGYLDCFKVMLGSMAYNGVLTDNPIVIYTDDKKLLSDSFVQLVADKVSLLDGKRKETLYSLAKENVKRPERADWNRGTFLKWSVFEKQETSKLLFLDVDMIVHNPMQALFDAFPNKPLVTSPQFQQSLREGDTDSQLLKMYDGQFDGKHIKRINSGMMLVSGDFLCDAFFNTITQYASERISIHEQGLLSEYFGDKRKYIGMVSSTFNFQDSFLRLASDKVYRELLEKISVLHYAGAFKPWTEKTDSIGNMPSIKLWHDYKDKSVELFGYK